MTGTPESQAINESTTVRNGTLLISLCLLIFLPPFLPGHTGHLVLKGLNVALLLTAARAATSGRTRNWLVLAPFGLALVGTALYWGARSELSVYAFLLSLILFLSAVVVALMSSLLTDEAEVDLDKIYGAVSVYLLLGVIWSLLFALLEHQSPGSFTQSEFFTPMPDDANEHYQRFIGFSFITLTTLGYGHISPANAQADALSSAEAIVGQLYLAVVIARLVALQVSHSNGELSRDETPE